MLISAEKYGVIPGKTDVKALEKLFASLSEADDEKELVFSGGDYYINALELEKRMMYITNTVGDGEFSADETPHENRAALYFRGIKNLTVNGCGARFIIDGKATNIAVENCENITIKNLELSALKPDLHEIRVINKGTHFTDFEADGESDISFEDGKLFFSGNGYKVKANHKARQCNYICLIKEKTPDKIERVRHPLANTLKIKPLEGKRFRAYYIVSPKSDLGDRFYLYSSRRQYVGIFINKSKNITLESVSQRFNYSLALVMQDSENLSCDSLDFSPSENGALKMTSTADFAQISSCRGLVSVKNSFFCGAGDDCINVHGIHFKIVKRNENKITVRFMHPQTHGFNPLRVGDTVAFINSSDLLEYGRAEIKESRLVNEYNIELLLSGGEFPKNADNIENISACPEFVFENNTVNRIITRAVLYTSRGKCLIKNNHFISNTMSGVLLSDDAKNWYESGMCEAVTISGNTFDYCGETPILIKPENTVHHGAVHKNITIENNIFKKYDGVCISAKSADNILISGNTFLDNNPVSSCNCENISLINNSEINKK